MLHPFVTADANLSPTPMRMCEYDFQRLVCADDELIFFTADSIKYRFRDNSKCDDDTKSFVCSLKTIYVVGELFNL